MNVNRLETVCFDQWRVEFSVVQRLKSALYKISILGHIGSSRYDYSSIYLGEAEAHRAAYFLCLRNSLDQQFCPALLIDLKTGFVLSSNLAAFEILRMDATGAHIADFVMQWSSDRPMNHHQGCLREFHSSMLLCNADGMRIECETTLQIVPHSVQWAIFYFNPTSPLTD